MLHVAALADSPQTYAAAVKAAVQFWLNGKLTSISAEELQSIIDGEFWLLSSQARASGAGFVLKETLANARRELEASRSPNNAS